MTQIQNPKQLIRQQAYDDPLCTPYFFKRFGAIPLNFLVVGY